MLNSFINYLIYVEGKSNSTVKMYSYDIKEFLKFCEKNKIKVKKATTNDLYNYMTYLAEIGLKPITRARQCSAIRMFYSYLEKQGLKNNPAKKLKRPKIEKKEVCYLNLNDSIKLLKRANFRQERNHERNNAIIILFLNLGIRLAELVNINIEDIDFTNNQIKIKGKGGKERILFLNNNCIEAINKYRKNREIGALFLSEQKKRISRRTVQYIVKNEIKDANLSSQFTTHKLRHTCATNMYQSGIDIRILQKILGHSSLATTEIYIHTYDHQIKNAIDKIGKLYQEK